MITNYPLCCYSNGEIVIDGENVSYSHGIESFVFVNRDTSFSHLVSLICEELEVDMRKFQVNIKLKYPCAKGFKLISLNNDKALNALWASVEQSKAHSMDIYVELIPISSSLEITTSFTNLLSQVIRGDDSPVCLLTDYDENVEDEDRFLLNDFDENNDDLVSPTAPNLEYSTVHPIDEIELNCICGGSVDYFEKNNEFCVGQVFKDKETLTQVVSLYNIRKCQTFCVTESRTHTVTYTCSRKPNKCTWYLRASKKDSTYAFTIVTYRGPHKTTCVSETPPLDHPNLNTVFISNAIRPLVEADWGVKVSIIKAEIKLHYKYTISYMKAWHAKQRAISMIFGDWEESYEILPKFLQALKIANPGTVVQFANTVVDTNVEQFDRVFWAFGPSIKGFKHCRPVITIDGTHLYGKYKGVLLIAMGVDANEQIYPLAFAIVESESVNTWSWFMCCIRYYVTQRQGICVISDRHIGILRAMNEVGGGWEEPHGYHRFCIRHHASNINTKFKCAKLKKLFNITAHAHELKNWKLGMEKIGDLNMTAKALLESIPESKWSMANDGGYRYGIRTSNLAECFNGVLKSVRFLPITALVKATFFRVNSYFVARRDISKFRKSNGELFSEKIVGKLVENTSAARQHNVDVYDREKGIYGVVSGGDYSSHVVNILEATCTCNKWQIYHYPCSHVMAVCSTQGINPDQFVDHFYSSEEYYASYRPTFNPILDEAYWMPWSGCKLVPNPEMKRGGGRPKSSRIANEMDQHSTDNKRTKVTCSICNGEGHNKRTCPMKASSSGPSG